MKLLPEKVEALEYGVWLKAVEAGRLANYGWAEISDQEKGRL